MNTNQQPLASSITFDDGQIQFRSGDYGSWDMNVNAVVLVGEYTTQDGPMIEDHFVVMVTEDRKEFEIPVSAKGLDNLLKEIVRVMHVDIVLKLGFHADFASRIIVPISLEGKPLYVFANDKQPIWRRLFTSSRVTRILSPDVLRYCCEHQTLSHR